VNPAGGFVKKGRVSAVNARATGVPKFSEREAAERPVVW
jgi:hypothetical protein